MRIGSLTAGPNSPTIVRSSSLTASSMTRLDGSGEDADNLSSDEEMESALGQALASQDQGKNQQHVQDLLNMESDQFFDSAALDSSSGSGGDLANKRSSVAVVQSLGIVKNALQSKVPPPKAPKPPGTLNN